MELAREAVTRLTGTSARLELAKAQMALADALGAGGAVDDAPALGLRGQAGTDLRRRRTRSSRGRGRELVASRGDAADPSVTH